MFRYIYSRYQTNGPEKGRLGDLRRRINLVCACWAEAVLLDFEFVGAALIWLLGLAVPRYRKEESWALPHCLAPLSRDDLSCLCIGLCRLN